MLLLLLPLAAAQQFSFPTSSEDYAHFYPTAYFDHGGVDWACGGMTYGGHNGNDFGGGSWAGMSEGRDIVAAADGTVVLAHDGEFDECTTGDCEGGWGFGNFVKLQHADGRVSFYAHMKEGSVSVALNQWVVCGEKLGEMGSSGYSTGPHVHFEVRDASGESLDPFSGECSPEEGSWVVQGDYNSLPGLICDEVEPCEPVAELACGEVYQASNGDAGATDSHQFYGCGNFTWSGPEIALRFATDRDESVTILLNGLSADLDLFVLQDESCDGSGCLGHSENSGMSEEEVTFSATANSSYVVVIDGWEDAVTEFSVVADCSGSWPQEPGDSGSDSGVEDTDRGEKAEETGEETGEVPGEGKGGGCSCVTAPGRSLVSALWWLIAGVTLIRRRPIRRSAGDRHEDSRHFSRSVHQLYRRR